MLTIITFILALVYAITVIGSYIYLSLAFFNPKGRWYGIRKNNQFEFIDYLIMFIPLLSLPIIIGWVTGDDPIEK